MTTQQVKKYKIAGWITLVLSIGIYFAGGATESTFHLRPQQFQIVLLVVSVLLLINAIVAIIITYKLRGKGNTAVLAAAITSIVMGLISLGGASFIGSGAFF